MDTLATRKHGIEIAAAPGGAARQKGVLDGGRAGRRDRLMTFGLLLPSLLFVGIFFLLPISLFLFRSVDNSEIVRLMPQTIISMDAWQDQAVPPDAVYDAIAADISVIAGTPDASMLGRRLNHALPGYRGLITRTARNIGQLENYPDARSGLVAIDPAWADERYLSILRQQSGRLTDFYLLTALDLERSVDNSIQRVADQSAIFGQLYWRTLSISVGVTALCLLIGFPVAAMIARASPNVANWLLIVVLIPFWTSLLVRTTAWVILLQNQGLINSTLLASGIIPEPLSLIYTRTAVYIAMVHVLLPYMVLPLYSIMKSISPMHLRAAASLGATPLRVFWTIYMPLTMPGIVAGSTLVFILCIGFYITPALVGGPSDQMIGYFIAYFTNSAINWGLASALGVFLLLMIVAVYLAVGRVVGFDKLRIR